MHVSTWSRSPWCAAHENLVAAATANRVGTSHGPPKWAGGSVIAATQFPGFPVTLARAGADEELITADLDFAAIAEWYDLLPWREWRAGPQRPVSQLIAAELAALAECGEVVDTLRSE